MLAEVLRESEARVHGAGHSFGARVMMSAIAVEPLPRRVRSLLLLQAAVNRWCFAPDVLGSGRPGGYHVVLDRVELPILTTFSPNDAALRQVFHLVMRGSHVGEPDIAAVVDTDRYGALGGFGPAGLGDASLKVPMSLPDERYDLAGGHAVIALDGAGPIGDHGDISNPATWWALHNLVESEG